MSLKLRVLVFCLLASTAQVSAQETLKEGRIITVALGGARTILAPSPKEANIFQLLLRSDLDAVFHRSHGMSWYADALAVEKYNSLLEEYTKKGLFTEIKKPSKAIVTRVITSAEIVCPNIYEIQILEGPLKDKRFGYSFDYDRRIPLFFEPGYMYFMDRPVDLAFDLFVYRLFQEAVENSDTTTVNKLKRNGRVWQVPINSKGRILEKDGDLVYARFEILNGPMKGKRGWGRIVYVNRTSEPSKPIR